MKGTKFERKKDNKRKKREDDENVLRKKEKSTGGPRIEKMTFKIIREKSKPFINFETIIEDLVQVS